MKNMNMKRIVMIAVAAAAIFIVVYYYRQHCVHDNVKIQYLGGPVNPMNW